MTYTMEQIKNEAKKFNAYVKTINPSRFARRITISKKGMENRYCSMELSMVDTNGWKETREAFVSWGEKLGGILEIVPISGTTKRFVMHF